MNKDAQKIQKSKFKKTKKKWEKPVIKENSFKDINSSSFNEVLLSFGDPGASKG